VAQPWQTRSGSSSRAVVLGLRENAAQFSLLVLVNAFVGATVGVERSVLPLLAESRFGVTSATALLAFIAAFGLAKAVANYVAGELAGSVGRRRVLIAGWVLGIPVPLVLMWAPSWAWVIAANVLLGASQGLAWSATVIMKIDLVGPARRGLAMGLNEAAGYGAVALAAAGAGLVAAEYGPDRAPFAIALVAALLGLGVSVFWVRDTAEHVALEARNPESIRAGAPAPESRWRRLAHFTGASSTLAGAHQAGLVNNLNDGLAWALLPLVFASGGLSLREIGLLAAVYPAVWGISQIVTGELSDRGAARGGRRIWIASGMLVQAAGLLIFSRSSGLAPWAIAAVLLGVGTAAVYPTLLAVVADAVSPAERAPAVGTYRLWRDLGYVAGALIAGPLADWTGYRAAIAVAAALTALSGAAAAVLLRPGRPMLPAS
jgi:MFS family permease